MIKRYEILLILSLLNLNSCSVLDNNNIAPGYKEAIKSITNLVFGYQEDVITKELVENIPYASSTLKIGKGPKGLIILESKIQNNYIWVSADGIFLKIKNGRIIETSGLNNNLTSTVDPFRKKNLFQQLESQTYKYYQSYDEPLLNNLEIEVTIKNKGQEIVTILGEERKLRVFSEIKTNEYLGWKAENTYWLDDNNFVWKSEQYISPKLPKLVIEVTKKPSI